MAGGPHLTSHICASTALICWAFKVQVSSHQFPVNHSQSAFPHAEPQQLATSETATPATLSSLAIAGVCLQPQDADDVQLAANNKAAMPRRLALMSRDCGGEGPMVLQREEVEDCLR